MEDNSPIVVINSGNIQKVLDCLKTKLNGNENDTRTLVKILLDPETKALAGTSSQQMEMLSALVRCLKEKRDKKKYKNKGSKSSKFYANPWTSRLFGGFDCGNVMRTLILTSKNQKRKQRTKKHEVTPVFALNSIFSESQTAQNIKNDVLVMNTSMKNNGLDLFHLGQDVGIINSSVSAYLMSPFAMSIQKAYNEQLQYSINESITICDKYNEKFQLIHFYVNLSISYLCTTLYPLRIRFHQNIIVLVPRSDLVFSEESSPQMSSCSSNDSINTRLTTSATQTSLSDDCSNCSSCESESRESNFSNGYNLIQMKKKVESNPKYQQLLRAAEKIVGLTTKIHENTQCNIVCVEQQNSSTSLTSSTESKSVTYESETFESSGASYLSKILCHTRIPQNYLTTPEIVISCSDWNEEESGKETSDESFSGNDKLKKDSSNETVVFRNCISETESECNTTQSRISEKNKNLNDNSDSEASSERAKLSILGSIASLEECISISHELLPDKEESFTETNSKLEDTVNNNTNDIDANLPELINEHMSNNNESDLESISLCNEYLETNNEACSDNFHNSTANNLYDKSQKKTWRRRKRLFNIRGSSSSSLDRIRPSRFVKLDNSNDQVLSCEDPVDWSRSRTKLRLRNKGCSLM